MGLPSSGPITFDESKVATAKLPMLDAAGYSLSAAELQKIFGINANRFGALPKRIVVPILRGSFYQDDWYKVTGALYVLEPVAWAPVVSHGGTLPVSHFETDWRRETKKISETKFNASTSAGLEISAGGSYMGVSASVKSSSEISFSVDKSTTVDEVIHEGGHYGDIPVHELFVYPNLKCKVVRKQSMEYMINDKSSELKWSDDGGDSYGEGFWPEREVANGRLGRLTNLAWHPVPIEEGEGLRWKGYILAAPQNASNGDVDVTTVMSRQGWIDWYHYDVGWDDVWDETMMLAVPTNEIAFQPMGTWAVLDADRKK